MGTSEYFVMRFCSLSRGMQYAWNGTISSLDLAGFMAVRITAIKEKRVIIRGSFILVMESQFMSDFTYE